MLYVRKKCRYKLYLKGLNVLTVFLMREDSSEKEKILQVVHENQY